ncbi:hypothetical protein PY365_30515 [Roseiarcaceae bacterium H3SJ34-1]|uniref:hypothetical protein n=1 Tax=Terripilifer ovatus TaxID=3032367 RepID=UPI003AB95FA4|nr:hypothetical protein [Roseiarcaceae bacterium H3SJ34-1]
MSDIGSQIAATMFKPAPGGYVFREPYRWVFGRARHYLVSEAQRAQIVAVVVPRRPIFSQMMLWTVFCLMVALAGAIVWAYGRHDNPSAGDVVAMVVLAVIQAYAGLLIFRWRQLRRLRPVLAGASSTDERITPADALQALNASGGALSARQLVLTGAVSLVGSSVCAMSFVIFLIMDRSIAWLFLPNAGLFGGLAMVYFRKLMLKLEQAKVE